MTSIDIMLYVDKHNKEDGITDTEIVEYVKGKCGETEHSRQLCMLGIARLAGYHQIEGNTEEHTRLLNILKTEYWSFTNDS